MYLRSYANTSKIVNCSDTKKSCQRPYNASLEEQNLNFRNNRNNTFNISELNYCTHKYFSNERNNFIENNLRRPLGPKLVGSKKVATI